MLEIVLPYPPKELMPNRKNGNHWAKTHKVKQETMQICFTLTKEAMQGALFPKSDTYPLEIIFMQPDMRKRDLDNLLASAKCSLDSVAQALKIDDRQFEPITVRRGYEKNNSCMLIKIGD